MKLQSHNKDANGRVLIKPRHEERHTRAVFKIDAEESLPHCFVCNGVPSFTITLEAHEELKGIVTLVPIIDGWMTLNDDNKLCEECKAQFRWWRDEREKKVKAAEELKKNPPSKEKQELINIALSFKHMAETGDWTQEQMGEWLQRSHPDFRLTPKSEPTKPEQDLTEHALRTIRRNRERGERETRTVLRRDGNLSYRDDLSDHPLAGSDENEDD